jgi:signal peptidase I
MSGESDAQMERAVAACLASGPGDVLELLVRLRRGHAVLLGRQEGALHALLQAGIRSRRLVLAGRSPRGLAQYAVADGAAPDAADAPIATSDDPPVIPDARARIALRVARAARDDADRARIFSDIAAHLGALEQVDATRRFGSPRLLRTLMRRADRGRSRVLFAHTTMDKLKRLLLHEGPWILGVVATYFLLRTFVLNVYVIPSGSMRTSLAVGDRVVVRRGGTPERWRIWVFETDKAIVKRIAGLGGETIAIYQGDVFIDDELEVKPDEVREALKRPGRKWIAKDGTLLDWDRRDDDGSGDWTCRNWPSDGDVWIGNTRTTDHAPPVPLHDGYLDFDVERPADQQVGVVLSRGFLDTELYPEAVAWFLVVSPDGTALVEIREDRKPVKLAVDTQHMPTGRVRLSLAYVDGVVRARVGDWTHEVAREARYHRLQARLRTGPGATPIAVHFAPDVHYSADGEHGVSPSFRGPPRKTPYKIKPGHFFFLGDNTRNSEDSRRIGTISADQLIGPVVWRLWPIGRIGTPK